MSTPKFIVSHEDQQLGPFDEQELKAKWNAGAILGVDYIYDEKKQDWVMLAERFRWAAAGALTETVKVTVAPPPMTEKIPLDEVVMPPPAPAPKPRVEEVTLETEEHSVLLGEKTLAPLIAPPVVAKKPSIEFAIEDGYGEISLEALAAGQVELAMRNHDLPTSRIRLDLLPADPVEVKMTLPKSVEVGYPAVVTWQVVDERGLQCTSFGDEVTVLIAEKRHRVKTIDGAGRYEFSQEKAETVSVHLEFDGAHALRMPPKHDLEWTAGQAVRLEVDGPTEHQSGIPLKVRVKALDRFGNVARSYRGTVSLDVKAG